jgi:hypothetical protein
MNIEDEGILPEKADMPSLHIRFLIGEV